MNRNSRDPTFDQALADPMSGAVVQADHVHPRGFEIMTRIIARRLDGRRRRAPRPAAFAFAPMDVAAW